MAEYEVMEKILEVAKSLDITAEKIIERKKLLSFSAADEAALQFVAPLMNKYSGELIDAFYHHLMQFPYIESMLGDESKISHLKRIHTEYFNQLLSGVYDFDYALDRLRIALVHEKIGLRSEWYTGDFGCYIGLFNSIVIRELENNYEQVNAVLSAFSKLVLLDITLSLDAYGYANNKNIVHARDQALELYRKQTKSIERLAYYDSLTGLPNRNLLADKVSQLLEVMKHERRKLVVIYISIINFKEVNDTFGHDAGDKLIKAVGARFISVLSEVSEADVASSKTKQTNLVVARIAGDEFVIAGLVDDEPDIMVMISNISQNFTEPFDVDGSFVKVRNRYGIALSPLHGNTFETLLRHAHCAMYQTRTNSSMICFYDSLLGEKVRERAFMAHRLESVIAKGSGLQLRFQPQVDLTSYQICGAEVLLRWFDDELGWVNPKVFIPLAEERGLINEITLLVVRMAGQQLRAWIDKGLCLPARIRIKLAVNISARDLDNDCIVSDLLFLLDKEGLKPDEFELELTETGLMHDPEEAINMLNILKSKGFSLAIDDFGTGYSSLNYLRDINADLLKIDMSFIKGLDQGNNNTEIVKTIINIAHAFGMKTLAEGVENQRVSETLKVMGCDFAQGYYYSRPLTAKVFEEGWLVAESKEKSNKE